MRVAAAVILLTALSACTPGMQGSPGPAAGAETGSAAGAEPISLETGTDVGNGRPTVSHDGLMVRRRAVIAVHPTPEFDLRSVRSSLDQAAAGNGMELYEISPDVLDPAVLDHLVPELIVALPPDAVRADAEQVAERAFGPEASYPGVEHLHVALVLVHDLRFTLASTDPGALLEFIAAEGILSDALGNYATSLEGSAVTVSYTGPLLSDALVEAVRTGMARSAGVTSGDVAVTPRSPAGEGVDLSKEPEPEPESGQEAGSGHSGNDDPGHEDDSRRDPGT
ncbi:MULTISPECIES: hypothetical protein [Arthrobacter]|nr:MULTISPECIES: hypothetical protein [Arthrobacter]QYF90193.1 hypothetical protein KY499_02215 [Arthrobacter sp. PAMC25284]